MIIKYMSNSDKCHGEKQAGKCKKKCRRARPGAILTGGREKAISLIYLGRNLKVVKGKPTYLPEERTFQEVFQQVQKP